MFRVTDTLGLLILKILRHGMEISDTGEQDRASTNMI